MVSVDKKYPIVIEIPGRPHNLWSDSLKIVLRNGLSLL